ncbi:MAG: c-type cytochrome [Pseudomonadota bacterium]
MITAFRVVLIAATALFGVGPSTAETPAEYGQAMRLPADSAEGRRLYQSCAQCHGANGEGSSSTLVPRIGGQHFSVLIRQLVDYRQGKRQNERMQVASDEHRLANAQAIANVATFINLLKTKWPANKGTGLLAQEGALIYDARCRGCHGPAAQGDDAKVIPRLAGQNYGYLVKQFGDIAAGKRPNVSRQHVDMLKGFEYQEITALSDYLSLII